MSQAIQKIITERRLALIRRWVANPLVQVSVENVNALNVLANIDLSTQSETEQIGRRASGRVVMVKGDGSPHSESVWVAKSYSDYAGAYAAFLNKVYGVKVDKTALRGVNIDHILNKARAPKASTLIRIEAIAADVNQDWGRLFERAASHPDFYANKNRERRTMSWVIAAKIGGEAPPRGPKDEAGIRRLSNFFKGLGLDSREAEDGLRNMLDFAYRHRA